MRTTTTSHGHDNTHRPGRMRALVLAVVIVPAALRAPAMEFKTIPTADGSSLASATIETSRYRVTIRFDQGAKVSEFFDKKTGANGVSWGQPAGSGFLDDRHVFSAMPYRTAKVTQAENRIVIPCSVRSDAGVELRKTYTFEEDRNFFRVSYDVLNHGYHPYTLWVKCLGVPCGGETTEGDVSVSFVSAGKRQSVSPWPNTYYPDIGGGWMALLRASKRAGYFVVAEPQYLDKFYFWSGSPVTPTFEWIYRPIAPGYSFRTTVLLGLLHDVDAVEWITPQGQTATTPAQIPPATPPNYTQIKGWQSLEEIYQPTAAEEKRGFIPTVLSSTAPRQRLEAVTVDVGRNEGELVPIEVFALERLTGLRLELTGPAAADRALRYEAERDYRLLPGETAADVPAGSYGRLWLRILPGAEARTITGSVVVVSDQGRAELPLTVTVWPLDFPAGAMLPLNPFVGPIGMRVIPFLEGKDTDTFPVLLDVMQAIGVKSAPDPFTANPTLHYKLATEKQTGLPVYAYLAKHGPVTVETLPELDFSAFDPAMEMLKTRGITRIVLETGTSGFGRGWQQFDHFGKTALGRPVTAEEEGWKILMWAAKQYRDYLHSRGFTNLWAKIADEISADAIPAWLEAARHWRAAGFKTFTTNSIGIPRSVEHLARMNTSSDGWMVQTTFTRDFLDRTRRGSVATRMRGELAPPAWARYTNGGALNTWVTPRGYHPFPKGVDPLRVEDFSITANGVPLEFKHGSSPWGNKREGVAFRIGTYVYVSLPGGASPQGVTFEIAWKKHSVATTGEPAVRLDHQDSQWYYGGGYFTAGYLHTRSSTWLGSVFRLHGRGHYVVYHWLPERRLFWYEPGKPVVYSPAYEGLRDAEEDSAYYRALVELQAPREVLEPVAGFAPDAAVRFAERRSEAAAWDDVATDVTFADFNLAKRRMLQALVKIKRP